MGFETVDPSVLGTTPVDAAVVASDTAHHVADSLKFGSNVHLLVEKPAATDAASAAAFPGVRPLRTATARALGSASASASVSAAAGAASAAAGALSQNGWEARGEEGEGEEDEGEEEGEGEVEEDDGYEAGSIHATDDCRSSLIATDCLPHQVRR